MLLGKDGVYWLALTGTLNRYRHDGKEPALFSRGCLQQGWYLGEEAVGRKVSHTRSLGQAGEDRAAGLVYWGGGQEVKG